MKGNQKNIFIGILIFTLIIVVSFIFILPIKVYGGFIFTLEIFIGVCILIYWHSRNYAFICGCCNHKFTIGVFKGAMSIHSARVRYLKCPRCKKRTWAKETII